VAFRSFGSAPLCRRRAQSLNVAAIQIVKHPIQRRELRLAREIHSQRTIEMRSRDRRGRDGGRSRAKCSQRT